MLRRRYLIRSADEASSALAELRSAVSQADLPPSTRQFLEHQVQCSVEPLVEQLRHKQQTMNADRVLEGDGYRVAIKVRTGDIGLVERLRDVIGI